MDLMEPDSGFPAGGPSDRDTHVACRRRAMERWSDGFFKGLMIGGCLAFFAVLITIAVLA